MDSFYYLSLIIKEKNMLDWIKGRLGERTSLDGAVAIGGGIVMILIPTSLIGWGLIAYGAWTIWKKED
tara:strand:+ start:601 stop:804 length:204 start_codon:yes stop_codon:yes gene_type:complete